jgi:hypothetical protein
VRVARPVQSNTRGSAFEPDVLRVKMFGLGWIFLTCCRSFGVEHSIGGLVVITRDWLVVCVDA